MAMNVKEAARLLGKIGGKSTSPKKQQASRENGKKNKAKGAKRGAGSASGDE